MKFTELQKEQIKAYKKAGWSSREIAGYLGVSKSGVNDYLNGSNSSKKSSGPNILLFDLESAPTISAHFGRFKVNIGVDNVIEENGNLISVCYKFLGDKKVTKLVQTPDEARNRDDSRLCAELYEAYEKADISVAHNNANFDHPLFKARLVYNAMPPPKNVRVVDTLKIARAMRFNSNKLDGLGNYLEVGRKMPTEGISLWMQCLEGNPKALKKMVDYNAEDVELLEKVYLKLRAFDPNPANAGQYHDDGHSHCPVCSSTNLTTTGNKVYTQVSEFEEIVCNDCGHRARTRSAVNSKTQRAGLLMTPR